MNLKSKLKTIRYVVEALIVKLALLIFYAMNEKKASDVAAKIAKFVGKKIPVHRLAYQNLSNAMPEISEEKKAEILDEMWDNLGRIVGEFPHIIHCPINEIERFVKLTRETLNNLNEIKNSKKGGIIFGAHTGNWEVGPKVFAKYGINASTVYRPLNNPYVEKMTSVNRGTKLITKGGIGARKIIEVIKNGGFVIILVDQKASEGELVKFFHDDAITATSVARIALKYNVPLIPVRSVRIEHSFKFYLELEKPLAFQRTIDLNFDTLNLTRKINLKLEEWIRQYPSQWFWVHNRWKK